MTIAEKLRKTDPETLFELIVCFRLEGLAKEYFPERLEDPEGLKAKEEAQEREVTELMRADVYTGRVERQKGALTQTHRPVFK